MRIALVCGEPSGDLLGAELIRNLKEHCPAVEIVGIGGPEMIKAGLDSWLDYSVFAVVGYWEPIKRLLPLWLNYRKAVNEIKTQRPQVFIGIDAPDLNLKLGVIAKEVGCKYVQYVCPSFWIWRQQRAVELKKNCDKVLALLPFEVEFCQAKGIPVEFVGHPSATKDYPVTDRKIAKSQLGLDPNSRLVGLFPGSRKNEIDRHIKLFLAACDLVAEQANPIQFTIAVPNQLNDKVVNMVNKLPKKIVPNFSPGQAKAVLAAADAAIVKSGTITLEAALLGCPQVVAYKTDWMLGSKLDRGESFLASLPNLILGRKVVEELLQEQATPQALAAELTELLTTTKAETLQQSYAKIRQQLQPKTNAIAAQTILQLVQV